MKVYTLTTQYANNMGAQLQCFALAEYLTKNEHVDCRVLDYHPIGAEKSWSYFNKPKTFRDLVKLIYCLINPILLINKIRKQRVMRAFIKQYIPLSETKYYRDNIINHPPNADAFICGSDQIWNFKYRCDLTYFFDFVNKDSSKIIAYAPSIADPWPADKATFIAPYLKRFDALSIREVGNLEQVRFLAPENSPIVVSDPVFLPSRSQWDEFAETKFVPNVPYILCYFLSVSPMAVATVNKIREITGLKVVHFNLNALDKFNSEFDIRYGGPTDFIGLIKNAAYVCTNSFHCSAFSIIYRKNFVFVPKNMANERITNLVNNFGLSDVFINKDKIENLTQEDLQVDYSQTSEKGEAFIRYSKDYLHKALFGDER